MRRALLALPLLALALLPLAAPATAFDRALCTAEIASPVNPGDITSLAPCPGIGPGSALVFRFGFGDVALEETYCTMAFLVTDGRDLYVATAGHCVEDSLGVPSVGDRVSAHGVPGTFGTVVHQWCDGQAVNGGCGAGTDFGLILVDDDKRSYAHADVCRWGAPTGGLYTADEGAGFVQHFGWGAAMGSSAHFGATAPGIDANPGNPATQARQGVLLDPRGLESAALVETAAISGDSGSGVLVTPEMVIPALVQPEAQALGVLTHISAGGLAFVQRLDVSLARAGAEMNREFTVVSSV